MSSRHLILTASQRKATATIYAWLYRLKVGAAMYQWKALSGATSKGGRRILMETRIRLLSQVSIYYYF